MRTVLMIVYYFPPQGSVQVLRALKFAKYLPEFGWKPIILSVKDILHYYYDENLLNELPPQVEIVRTGSLDPFRLIAKFSPGKINKIKQGVHESNEKSSTHSFINFRNTFYTLNRWISLPDSRFGWYPFAVHTGRKLIRENQIDIIYSSCPPNINHLVGMQLQKESGIPWITDFKDMWFDYPNVSPAQWHKNKMLNWEKKILQQASSVISINPAITADFQKRYKELPKEKFQTIIHGYDPAEYQGIQQKQNQKFTIVHTGSFYEPRQIPDYFFQAVNEWLKENPDFADKIQIQLIGTLTERQKRLATELGLDRMIQYVGSVNRQKSIEYQVNADVLLLLVGDGVRSELVLPAKTWEYLASGRKILCLAPRGITADIINEHKAGVVISPSDVIGVKNAINKLYLEYSTNTLLKITYPQYYQYDRKSLTGDLATLFEKTITNSKNPST